jgi:hypothetical protein
MNVTLKHTFTTSLTGRPLTIDQPITEYLSTWDTPLSESGQYQLPIEEGSFNCLIDQFSLQQMYFAVNNDIGQMAMAKIAIPGTTLKKRVVTQKMKMGKTG